MMITSEPGDDLAEFRNRILDAIDAESFAEALEQASAWAESHQTDPFRRAIGLYWQGKTHAKLGQPVEAKAAYRESAALLSDRLDAQALDAETTTLWALSSLLHEENDLDGEIAICERIAKRLAGSQDEELAQRGMRALVNKGFALGELGRNQEEIALYREMLSYFHANPLGVLRPIVAASMLNMVTELQRNRELTEAFSMTGAAVDMFGNDEAPETRGKVALILLQRAGMLWKESQFTAAEKTYLELFSRYGANPDGHTAPAIVIGMDHYADLLVQTGQAQAAITICEEIEARFGDFDHELMRETVLSSLCRKAKLYLTEHHPDKAQQATDDTISYAKRYNLRIPPAELAELSVTRGEALAELKELDQAITTFGFPALIYLNNPGGVDPLVVCRALHRKIALETDLRRLDEALKSCDELIEMFSDDTRTGVEEFVSLACKQKATIGIDVSRTSLP